METGSQQQGFLTVKEAAAALRLSENTIYRLTRSGVVESVKVGGSVRIPARALHPVSVTAAELQNLAGRRAKVAPAPTVRAPARAEQ